MISSVPNARSRVWDYFTFYWLTRLTPSTPAVPNCCCSKGLAPYWCNPPFLIFDIQALWRSGLCARAPECQKFKMVCYTSMAKCKALTGSSVKGLEADVMSMSYTLLKPKFSEENVSCTFKMTQLGVL